MMYADIPPPIIACTAGPEQRVSGEAVLAEASAARLAGDYAGAECALERLLLVEPQNADAWVQLGFIHSASGDAARARAAFLRALAIAPDYDDAKFGLAQIAYRSGDLEGARAWLQRIDSNRRNDPEIGALRDSLAASRAGPRGWRVDAFAAYSRLSNDLAPWREASVAVSRRAGANTLGVAIERLTRFDASDTYGEARFARTIGDVTWGLAFGGASHPDFRPEALARAEFATPEDGDWTFDGSMTIARYRVGQVDRLALRGGRKLCYRLHASAQAIVVRDEVEELRTGYSVGAAWDVSDRLELSVVWADAPESSEGATIDVRSLGLGAAFEIAPDLRVRIGVMQERRDAFDRVELSMAVARIF